MNPTVADANRVGIARKPRVANVDIATGCGEIRAGCSAHCDVVDACVLNEAAEPTATLPLPVVLKWSAFVPMAVFS